MLYGFALPVLIVVLASLYIADAMKSMRDAAHASVEATRGLELRYALLDRVVDSETALRGYLLSSDPEFLQPYEAAPAELARVGSQLEVTEAGQPEHIRKLRDAQVLFKAWRDGFAEPLIRLRKDAPIGIDDDLEQLVELAAAPAQERARDHAREQVQLVLLHSNAGGRVATLRPLLERMENNAPLDPASLASLRRLADAYRQDCEKITSIIQSKRGKRTVDQIRALVAVSLQDQLQEQRENVDAATAITDRGRWIARLGPVLALLLGLSLVLLLLLDAIRAIGATTKAAEAVAAGDLDKRVKVMRADELGQLGNAFNRMAAELGDARVRTQSLDRFQTLLNTSNTTEELFQVVRRMCIESFPGVSGAIYRMAASRNLVDRVACWNWPDGANGRVIDPEECRALRSGHTYVASDASLEVPCRHTDNIGLPVGISCCLPLSAQGEVLGVLQLCRFGSTPTQAVRHNVATAMLISEQFSLALANLQLREQLRNQSIRDPLTGLFNRRYLEETMERELARSARNGQPLAVVAVDVDHFKRFNDTYGHEAGDRVLVELARVMRESVRNTDIACRYGGEEFVLLMPDSPGSIAFERAEALRAAVSALRLQFGTGQHEPVTISVGIANAPEDGGSAAVLLRNADIALYGAKARGRNQTVVFVATSPRAA